MTSDCTCQISRAQLEKMIDRRLFETFDPLKIRVDRLEEWNSRLRSENQALHRRIVEMEKADG